MSKNLPTGLIGWLATFALATLTTTIVYVLPQNLSWLIEPKPQVETQDIQDFDLSDW